MKKLVASVIYCLIPAVLAGVFGSLIDIGIGIVAFGVTFAFGLSVTKTIQERDEF